MILIKSFFRKKKTKIYITTFIILFTVMIVINNMNSYIKREYSNFKYNHSSYIFWSDKDLEEYLKKDKDIKSFSRSLSFEIGLDNDIIYNPPLVELEEGGYGYKDLDESKLIWSRLVQGENEKVILTYPSEELSDNEVSILIDSYLLDTENIPNYIGQDIVFKYNNKEVPLKIKEVKETNTYTHILISNEFYEKLLKEEKKYIYDIRPNTYEDMDKISDRLSKLENTNISLEHYSYTKNIEEQNEGDILENLKNIFQVMNIISTIIFFIIIIVSTKSILLDEEPEISQLKKIGYNKLQILSVLSSRLVLFDFIIMISSTITAGIIIILINKIFAFQVELWIPLYSIIILIFILLVEMFFELTTITKGLLK